MGEALHLTVRFSTITCCVPECGVSFAVPEWLDVQLRRSHRSFYCPHGHPQSFRGKSDLELAKEETERVRKNFEQRLKWAEESEKSARERAVRNERRANAFKGVATRVKKRIGNGVCPCCNRTFQNLMAHMKTKHPKYKHAKVDIDDGKGT